MYLEMIFGKNKEQTMIQLQFKFDPLPTKSAGMENSFQALGKWKMNFPCKENENFLRQHCLPFQDAPLCTIWDHLNKLCHKCGHKIDHLAWKPWIFTHDSSFLRTLFKNNFRITSLLFFLETSSHIMTQCEGFPIFGFFFDFFMPVSKCGQNGGLDRS